MSNEEKIKSYRAFCWYRSPSQSSNEGGYNFEIVDAIEIDKYAVKSYNAMYGENIEIKNICEYSPKKEDVGEIDLLFHGSPCQDFSLAGKQAGGDKDSGTRSSLMYETIRIVEELKPKYVVWENVKNLLSKKHRHNFDAYLETMTQLGYTNYYQVLNAKDYGIPQNRERVFTVSILNNNVVGAAMRGRYNNGKIEQYLEISDREYANAITTVQKDCLVCEKNQKFEFPEGKKCDNKINVVGNYMPSGHDASRIVDEYGLAPTVKENHGTITAVAINFQFPPRQELTLKLKDMLEKEVDEKYYLNDKQIEGIKCSAFHQENRRIQKKEYCDTLCSRDWKAPKCIQVAMLPYFNYESDGRVYSPNGISPCLRSKEPNQKIDEDDGIIEKTYNKNLRIRKLTPKECWRLMGFDDEDFEKAEAVNSNTQLYKQAGNSIVVNVLEAIFDNLLQDYK